MEIDVVNNSCITKHAVMITKCAPICIPSKEEVMDYCSEDCKHAVDDCLRDGASDWDSFIQILQKLTINFDKGFIEVCLKRNIYSLQFNSLIIHFFYIYIF